jgi:hypothetical protein
VGIVRDDEAGARTSGVVSVLELRVGIVRDDEAGARTSGAVTVLKQVGSRSNA